MKLLKAEDKIDYLNKQLVEKSTALKLANNQQKQLEQENNKLKENESMFTNSSIMNVIIFFNL